jgi:hypothetical protein
LYNGSGLKTGRSNSIHGIQVKASLGGKPSEVRDPQTARRASWNKLRNTSGWKTVEIDSSDPSAKRAPHYYEDSDGLLCGMKESPNLNPDESAGFLIQRGYHDNVKLPLSLAAFVRFDAAGTPVLASVGVRSDQESSRRMKVLWDGKVVGEFDVASYFEKDHTCTVEVPGASTTCNGLLDRLADFEHQYDVVGPAKRHVENLLPACLLARLPKAVLYTEMPQRIRHLLHYSDYYRLE